jgi:Tfp pilus assembly protein FimV
MAHQRELISQAVIALLVAAGTAAGARVYGTRVDPHKKSGLPALSVYTLNDPTNEDESSEMEVAHELELEIAGWVAHTEAEPVDDAMDALADQVEIAMRANEYLSGTASEVVHTGTVKEVVEDDGRSNPVVGIVVLTYAVKYHIALAVT